MTPTNQPAGPENIVTEKSLRISFEEARKISRSIAERADKARAEDLAKTQPAMPDNITPETPANPLPVTGGRVHVRALGAGDDPSTFHQWPAFSAWHKDHEGFEPHPRDSRARMLFECWAEADWQAVERYTPTPAPEPKEGERQSEIDSIQEVVQKMNEAQDKELRRWQEAIRDAILTELPDAHIDGGGCESGDPLDLALTEVSQGLTAMRVKLEEAERIALQSRKKWEACRDRFELAQMVVLNNVQPTDGDGDGIKAIYGVVSTLRAQLAAIEAQCEAKDTVLRFALSKIDARIQGYPISAYLELQFPATIGHIPLQNYWSDLGAAELEIQQALTPTSGNDLLAELERLHDREAGILRAQLTAAQQERQKAEEWIVKQQDALKASNTEKAGLLDQLVTLQQERDELRRQFEETLGDIEKSHTCDGEDCEVCEILGSAATGAEEQPAQQQEGGKAHD